jgi:choline dehydrogenase
MPIQGGLPKGEYDYLIIGAGSAGCVLAARLTEDPQTRVCLIEVGPRDRSLFIHMPAALTMPIESKVWNWKYVTGPEPHLNGRTLGQARGRGLGGSSSINGMVWVRGHPSDYDQWEAAGLAGWSFADCLPYFKKMENFEGGIDPNRGGNGPLRISRSRAAHPFYEAFLRAGEAYGLPVARDYNSDSLDGLHFTQATIHRGRRQSKAVAYLHPVAHRPNLTVLTGWRADRVLLEGGRATGVALRKGKETKELRPGREVILCAGTIGSAHMMLLSGIGPADHLRSKGVLFRHDLPGVGENLQDHFVASLTFRASGTRSIASDLSLWNRPRIGLEWLLTRGGLGATSFFEVGAFFRSGSGADYANMQHEFLPFLADFQDGRVRIDHGYQYFLSQMRPKSRGWLRLRSADPDTHPEIVFNYLNDPADGEEMLDGLAQTRDMARQAPWAAMGGTEVAPGPDVRSRAEALAWMRSIGNTEHHPVGTCRMGHDAMAVTDGEGLVHGLTGLRIVDGSILPYIPTANVNAPIIMVAEKITDRIRGLPYLARQRLKDHQGS